MFKELNILKLFFEQPDREFNVREAARILKITPATASRKLKQLSADGFLKEREERRFNLYKADLESEIYRDLKIFYNIRKIKESGLLRALNEYYLRPAVVLFGSAASGLDTKTSDFDLLIISEKTKEFAERRIFEKKMGIRLQLFVVRDIKELKNPHLINNILNGITIQGDVKWN